MSDRQTRVVVLTEIPAPFRVPLFNALADAAGVELEVIFLADHDPRRSYSVHRDEFGFSSQTLQGPSLSRGGRWLVLSRGVWRALVYSRPDILVVGGWNQPAFWVALLYGRRHRIPVVAWVESTTRDARPAFAWLERAKRVAVRRSTALLVPGRAAEEYVRALGASRDDVVVAPNAVDMSRFVDDVATARSERDAIRRSLGLTRPTILYVGRLATEKGIDVLLDAARDLDADVVLIGEGPEEERLRRLAPPNVRFVGWVEPAGLVLWYAAADAFVLPSRSEPWGMVLNEAAAAGLPIVATATAGAAFELVDDGVSGFRVEPDDVGALRAALERVVDDAPFRDRAGRRSIELAEQLRPERWADAVATLARRLDPAGP